MPSTTQLIQSLRSAHDKANLLSSFQVLLSLLVSLPAVFSILTNDNKILYWLATINVILLILRWWINTLYMKVRSHSLSARRVAMLLSGLGEKIHYSTHQSLINIKYNTSKSTNINEKNYYATDSPQGLLRLIEIIEECAFFSKRTHRSSANFTFWIVFLFISLFLITLLFQIPTATNSMLIEIVRVFFAATVFFLSSDVFGKAMSHKSASKKLKNILQRSSLLASIQKKDYTQTDVMILLQDYISAMESAPETIPFFFNKKNRKKLNLAWKEYKH